MSMTSENPHIVKAQTWLACSILSGIIMCWLTLILAYPIAYIAEVRISSQTIHYFGDLVVYFARNPVAMAKTYAAWVAKNMTADGHPPVFLMPQIFIGLMTAMFIWKKTGPHDFAVNHLGSSAWATLETLLQNELIDNCGIVIGRFGHYVRGPLLRNWETLSYMIISPPGTGKTVSLVSMLLADNPDHIRKWGLKTKTKMPCFSAFVNDPKGEIFDKTAGWRSTLGPVFHIRWNELGKHCFNPLSLGNINHGDKIIPALTKIFHILDKLYIDKKRAVPNFMLLARDFEDWQNLAISDPEFKKASQVIVEMSPLEIKSGVKAEDILDQSFFMHLTNLVTYYIELESAADRYSTVAVQGEGGNHSHWVVNGRAALTGFELFMLHRYLRQLMEHDGDTSKVPEASFGGILAWLAGANVDPDDQSPLDTTKPPPPQQGDEDDQKDDEVTRLLEAAIAEAKTFGYPPRVAQELAALKQKPPNERGSVISTAIGKLNIFKSAAVRARTSKSSFTFSQLRGIDGRPVTVYIDIPIANAEAVGVPTGFLLEGSATYLISQSEKKAKTRPVAYLIDEFWTLPALDALTQIPALGRGQWVQLIMIGQSFDQIAKKLGKEALGILKSAISIFIYFTINNQNEAEEISKSIGNRTMKTVSVGTSSGGGFADMFKKNLNENYQSQPLIRSEEIASLSKLDPKKNQWGKNIIQVAGMKNRPIMAKPVIWFKDKIMRKRAGYKAKGFIEGYRNDDEGRLIMVKDWQLGKDTTGSSPAESEDMLDNEMQEKLARIKSTG